MEFQFKINDIYLLLHSLSQEEEPFKGWKTFKETLIETYPLASQLLIEGEYPETSILQVKDLEGLYRELKKEGDEMSDSSLRSDEFKRLKKETKTYLDFVKEQWGKNEGKVINELGDITGLKLPKKTIVVYITHPNLYNGLNIPEMNIICWGHPEDWQNHSTVYIAHELLHILTFESYEDEETIHALIELACDNELRIRLNKGGEYFKANGKRVGHSYLRETEQKILPDWERYLKKEDRNILNLEKELRKTARL